MSTQATRRREQAFEEFARTVREELGDHIHEIILYGSTARGEATEHSDVDVLIVMDETPQREHRDAIFGAAFNVCLEYGVDVIPNIYSQSEFQKRRKNPFLTDALNEGRVYDIDNNCCYLLS
jgi:predicted nucleotidyltransferase